MTTIVLSEKQEKSKERIRTTIALRLDEDAYQRLRVYSFNTRIPVAQIVGALIEQAFPGEENINVSTENA